MKFKTGTYCAGTSDERWNLYEGSGKRIFRNRINFSESFETPPHLMVALSGFNIRDDYRASLEVSFDRVSNNGFDVLIIAYESASVCEVTVSWLAFGI